MESVGSFFEEEWELSLSRMFTEEADFLLQLQCHDKRDSRFNFGPSSTFWPIDGANMTVGGGVDHESFSYSSDTFNTNLHYLSQESSNSNGSNSIFFPTQGQENNYYSDTNHIQDTNNTPQSMDFCAMYCENNLSVPIFPDNALMEDILCLKEEIRSGEIGNSDADQPADDGKKSLQPKRKKLDMNNDSSETPKKKSRVSRNGNKGKKNAASKKSQKVTPNGSDEEDSNAGKNGQRSCCYNSEDDSNTTTQELNGGATSDSKGSTAALNSNGKTRAGRGAATDPQSLYARRRRERINERLRTLQNLVPNGTKVDISTMLEEAVHYVKFLQLQIKLLSSDDKWMFAPIAYNGMDMGLYHKISSTML